MKSAYSTGLYLFPKAQTQPTGLKEMLQFLRSSAPGKSLHFAYVECESALHPHLSLWENLQMVMGGHSWNEAVSQMSPDCRHLASLIDNPQLSGHSASNWERLTLALIKGVQTHSHHLLIDLDENMHSPLNMANLKKILSQLAQSQNILLASTDSNFWMDISHGKIIKEGYKFQIEDLTTDPFKSRRPA